VFFDEFFGSTDRDSWLSTFNGAGGLRSAGLFLHHVVFDFGPSFLRVPSVIGDYNLSVHRFETVGVKRVQKCVALTGDDAASQSYAPFLVRTTKTNQTS